MVAAHTLDLTTMLLATKCPYCLTTFRVVNDQLKLHAGVVRCGCCQKTFNGIEHLVGGVAPAALVPPLPPVAPVSIAPTELSITPPVEAMSDADLADEIGQDKQEERIEPNFEYNDPDTVFAPIDTPFIAEDPAEIAQPILLQTPEQPRPLDTTESKKEPFFTDTPDMVSKSADPLSALIDIAVGAPSDTTTDAGTEAATDTKTDAATDTPIEPHFIRAAKARKRMNKLILISNGVLFIILMLQATYVLRNQIAAMYPETKDTLVQFCHIAQCKITLPAQLDALSYEADELHSLPRESAFEFSLLLHNHSNLPQTWPHIELTLLNAQKQPILRRIFTPHDYVNLPQDLNNGFQPNQDLPIKLYFELKTLKASDYLVGIFYP